MEPFTSWKHHFAASAAAAATFPDSLRFGGGGGGHSWAVKACFYEDLTPLQFILMKSLITVMELFHCLPLIAERDVPFLSDGKSRDIITGRLWTLTFLEFISADFLDVFTELCWEETGPAASDPNTSRTEDENAAVDAGTAGEHLSSVWCRLHPTGGLLPADPRSQVAELQSPKHEYLWRTD